MRFRSSLVSSSLVAVVLLALAAGSAFAQICPQPPTGGNRLVATGTTGRTGVIGGWYASLLPASWTNASFRLPGRVAIAPAPSVVKRGVK